MSSFELPQPATKSPLQEHRVADPGAVERLADAIPYRSAVLERLFHRHLVSIRHLDRELIEQLLRLAAAFQSDEVPIEPVLAGKVVTTAYLDHSTSRTRLAFESATLRLGASIMDFGERLDEVEGGRGVLCEVVEMCSSLGDLAVVRTKDADTLDSVIKAFCVPVINAGNGSMENPSHTLADLYTLFKWRPDLLDAEPENPIEIGILGPPGHLRTLRGFLIGLTRFPKAIKRIVVFSRQAGLFSPGQREELEAAGIAVHTDLELHPSKTLMAAVTTELPQLDLIYAHSPQEQHISRQAKVEAFNFLKPDSMVLHPESRVEESMANLDNSPHNGYFAQARGGVFVRAAILAAMMGAAPYTVDEDEAGEAESA